MSEMRSITRLILVPQIVKILLSQLPLRAHAVVHEPIYLWCTAVQETAAVLLWIGRVSVAIHRLVYSYIRTFVYSYVPTVKGSVRGQQQQEA